MASMCVLIILLMRVKKQTNSKLHGYLSCANFKRFVLLPATTVCHSVYRAVGGGGCLPQCMLGYPPGADTPLEQAPQEQTPPWEQTAPREQMPPPDQTPPRADTPQEQTPLEQTPLEQTPLRADTPLGADAPFEQTSPQDQTPPRTRHPPGLNTLPGLSTPIWD